MPGTIKAVVFVGDSLRELQQLPDQARRDLGHALFLVQTGDTPSCSKALKGFPVALREIRVWHDKETYRGVYTANLGNRVYLLHVFHKKSTRGIATPIHEVEKIRARLQEAQRMEAEAHE